MNVEKCFIMYANRMTLFSCLNYLHDLLQMYSLPHYEVKHRMILFYFYNKKKTEAMLHYTYPPLTVMSS